MMQRTTDNWLSVIIAAYNAEKYLRDAIDSILLQTVLPSEIIVIDDGSEDGTGDIIAEYEKRQSGCLFKALHQENHGHTYSRKIGLEQASSEYVLIMDADDILATGILEELSNICRSSNPDVICFNYASFKTIDQIKPEKIRFEEGLYTRDMACKALFPRMLFTGDWYRFGIAPNMWNKIFRRELAIDSISHVPETIKHGEDGLMTYRALLGASGIYITNEIGYLYRSTSNSISYRPNMKRSLENIELFDNMRDMFTEMLGKIDVSGEAEDNYQVDKERLEYSLMQQLDYYIVYQCMNAMEPELREAKRTKDKSIIRNQKAQFKEVFGNEAVHSAFKNVNLKLIDGKKNKLEVLYARLCGR